MTQQPKRQPGDPNPVPDADAPMRPVREAESLARAAGVANHFDAGGGSITKYVIALLDRRKRRQDGTS